jgi:hypothetical protein
VTNLQKLDTPARALLCLSVVLAVVFAANHRSPVLGIAGAVLGTVPALYLSASGDTKTRWIWAGAFLNITGLLGMYAQAVLTRHAESLRSSPFVDEATLRAAVVAAYFAPAVLGGLAILLLRSNLPDSELPDADVPSAKVEPLDVVLGTVRGKPIVLKHEDRYLHTLVVGTTGTGKTSRVLKPMIWQDLQAIKRGERLGMSIIEPKGDFAADVAKMCEDLGVPYIFINPEDPGSPKFNPLEGDPQVAAEITRTVFAALFGKQEAFFALNQALAARNTVLLLKAVKGDDVTLEDMANALREFQYLRILLKQVESKVGRSPLVDYFNSEVLGMEEKAKQFQLGLRLQLDNIINNRLLHNVLCGKSDLNLDEHLEKGGVLIANTAMGTLGALGDAFGQFVIMHLQQAVFRRTLPPQAPHMLYVDEFPRYVNSDFERLLAIGRSFGCGACLAVQTTAQIQLEEKKAFKETVLETCRNKVILNLGSAEDARRFADEFGAEEAIFHSRSYNRQGVLLPWAWDAVREERKIKERYPYTALMELPKFTAAVRLVRRGQPLRPVLARLRLSPWDTKRPKRRALSAPVFSGFPDADSSGLKIDLRSPKPKKADDFFS